MFGQGKTLQFNAILNWYKDVVRFFNKILKPSFN